MTKNNGLSRNDLLMILRALNSKQYDFIDKRIDAEDYRDVMAANSFEKKSNHCAYLSNKIKEMIYALDRE